MPKIKVKPRNIGISWNLCPKSGEEQEIISILDNLTFDDREIVDIREYDCDI